MGWKDKLGNTGVLTAINPLAGTADYGIENFDKMGWFHDPDRETKKKITASLEEDVAAAKNLELPEYQNLDLDKIKYAGNVNFDPLAGSAMEGISVDPRLKEAQMAALASLQGVVDSGGMDAVDKANLSRIQSQAAQADKGRRDAILQNMNARGMGGSGMELLAQMQSSQAATDRQAQQGLDVAGMAQRRALEAMMQRGNMAGDMRGQEFGEQSDIAKAKDSIAQFNKGTQVQVDTRNMNTLQDVGTQNTGISNQQQIHNKYTLPGQQYQDQIGKVQAVSQARQPWVTNEQNKIDQKMQGRDRSGAAGGQAISAVASMFSDERTKKDIKEVKEVDIEEFLDSFSPKKFKYKSPKNGEGEFTGFIAQDVKDTKLGKDLVSEDEDGLLQYDPQKLQGIQLAAIKFLADKIKDKK